MAAQGLIGKPFIVIWDDAHGSLGEKPIEEVVTDRGVRTHTIGWLVNSNQHGLTLAVDLYEEDKKSCHTTCFIPHGMVVKKVKLKT